MSLIDEILFLGEKECYLCKNEKEDVKKPICKSCYERFEILNRKIEDKENGYTYYYALFYNNYLKELVSDFKFNNKAYLCKVFSNFIYDCLKANQALDFDLITYVPMYFRQEKKRGYNQAELLARELGKLLKVEVKEIFKKTRPTKEQNKINANERKFNLLSSMSYIGDVDKNIKNILLVDDIITTASTINSIIETCRDQDFKLTPVALASSKRLDID